METDLKDSCLFPEVTFSAFIMSLASAALVGLGEAPDPETGKTETNLSLARHNIDLLDMLLEKTSGNLNKREQELLDNLLYDLRVKYIMRRDNAD